MKTAEQILQPYVKMATTGFGKYPIVDKDKALLAMESYASQLKENTEGEIARIFKANPVNFLLSNALRYLNTDQLVELCISLRERVPSQLKDSGVHWVNVEAGLSQILSEFMASVRHRDTTFSGREGIKKRTKSEIVELIKKSSSPSTPILMEGEPSRWVKLKKWEPDLGAYIKVRYNGRNEQMIYYNEEIRLSPMFDEWEIPTYTPSQSPLLEALEKKNNECECKDNLMITFTSHGEYCGNCGKIIVNKKPYTSIKRDERYCGGLEEDGCSNAQCPQIRDGEPESTGRYCPLLRHEIF